MLSEHNKLEIRESITNNHHELCIVSLNNLMCIVKNVDVSPETKSLWADQIKGPVGFGTSWYGTYTDVQKLFKLIGELNGNRHIAAFLAKAKVVYYSGEAYVILSDRTSRYLRKTLTSYSSYLADSPKLVEIGLGSKALLKNIGQGARLSIYLAAPFRIIDTFLQDEPTLSYFVGSLATDIVKIGIATAAFAVGAAIGELTVFAIGPLVGAIIVSVITTLALNEIDSSFKITDRIIKKFDEIDGNIKSGVQNSIRQEISKQWSSQLRGIF